MAGISQKYKKDFSKVDFQNPRLVKEKMHQRNKIRKISLYFMAVVIVVLLIWLFFSPYFQIQNVNISGINKISTEKFAQIIDQYRLSNKFLIFSRNNLFLFSKKALLNRIGESYLLQSIEVNKDFPNTLNIEVKEKEAKIILITNNKCFHLDQSGQVIEGCDGGEVINLIKIYDDQNYDTEIGQFAIKPEVLDYLIKTNELLSPIIGIEVYHINNDGPYSIKLETVTNYDLLMNLELPYEEQIARFQALLASNDVQSQLSSIKYFDLRFGEKIYYK